MTNAIRNRSFVAVAGFLFGSAMLLPRGNAWVKLPLPQGRGPQNACTNSLGVEWKVDQCNTTAAEDLVIMNSIDRWKTGSYGAKRVWTYNQFNLYNTSCGLPGVSGLYEIALVPPGDPGLCGGSADGCYWEQGNGAYACGDERTLGATVFVKQTLTTGTLESTSPALGAREVAVHELTHAAGLDHNDDYFGVMCGFAGACGKLGNRSGKVYPNSIKRTEASETLLPDEMHYRYTEYSSSSIAKVNGWASPWQHQTAGVQAVLNHPGNPVRSLCRNATSNVTITLGSAGKSYLPSADWRIYLSADDIFDKNDIQLNGGTFNGPMGWYTTVSIPFAIPAGTPPGMYTVTLIVDPDGLLTQDTVLDDATATGLRINVLNC